MSRFAQYLKTTPADKQDSAAIAYLASLDHIEKSDPIIAKAISQELFDQRSSLKLIASENYCSLGVQLCMGNLLTDKYAEGHPNHRFYAGCHNVDIIEAEAVKLACKLFGAEHAYVQPHSGADANLVAFWSILVHKVQTPEVERLGKKTIDELTREEYEKVRMLILSQKMMGLSLNSGGHLTHGYRHNVSSKMMESIAYDVDPKTELIDYQALKKQVKREKPAVLLAGYSAYSRKIDFAIMREIADSVGAVLMVDMAHFAGLVAGKVFEGNFNPVPFAHIVTSTTHKTLRGPRGGMLLCTKEYADVVNKGCPLVLGGPLPHVLAAKAMAFHEALQPAFSTYAHNIVKNADALAQEFMRLGQRVVTNGTDNHLMVIDVSSLGITGRQAELALRDASINVNRNTVPGDTNGPWYTSGIRVGTPALTTLGMGPEEMREIARLIMAIVGSIKPEMSPDGVPNRAKVIMDPKVLAQVKQGVEQLLARYPLYPEIPRQGMMTN